MTRRPRGFGGNPPKIETGAPDTESGKAVLHERYKHLVATILEAVLNRRSVSLPADPLDRIPHLQVRHGAYRPDGESSVVSDITIVIKNPGKKTTREEGAFTFLGTVLAEAAQDKTSTIYTKTVKAGLDLIRIEMKASPGEEARTQEFHFPK